MCSYALTVMMCSSDNDIELTYCNDQYDYQFMRLVEDLFLLFKSVARGAFPPFFNHCQKVPYRVLNYL